MQSNDFKWSILSMLLSYIYEHVCSSRMRPRIIVLVLLSPISLEILLWESR